MLLNTFLCFINLYILYVLYIYILVWFKNIFHPLCIFTHWRGFICIHSLVRAPATWCSNSLLLEHFSREPRTDGMLREPFDGLRTDSVRTKCSGCSDNMCWVSEQYVLGLRAARLHTGAIK